MKTIAAAIGPAAFYFLAVWMSNVSALPADWNNWARDGQVSYFIIALIMFAYLKGRVEGWITW